MYCIVIIYDVICYSLTCDLSYITLYLVSTCMPLCGIELSRACFIELVTSLYRKTNKCMYVRTCIRANSLYNYANVYWESDYKHVYIFKVYTCIYICASICMYIQIFGFLATNS